MKAKTIVLATDNPDKVRELEALFAGQKVVSKKDLGFSLLTIEENGDSLEANARLKVEGLLQALEAADYDPDAFFVLGDDTGLFVHGLGGRPGIYSARYAGPACRYADNVNKLLAETAGFGPEERKAYFETVICYALDGKLSFVHGRLDGEILPERRGQHGFGYDPVFFLPSLGKTLAELGEEEKNQISHRGRAYQALLEAVGEGFLSGTPTDRAPAGGVRRNGTSGDVDEITQAKIGETHG